MKPWKSAMVLHADGTLSTLQWGHGDEAVEELSKPFHRFPQRSLQWGHGDEAVEEEEGFRGAGGERPGFNGATAMKPWKRRGAPPCRGSSAGFNGATAMKPWKRWCATPIGLGSTRLQWGHGDEAVEEMTLMAAITGGEWASMGPRR